MTLSRLRQRLLTSAALVRLVPMYLALGVLKHFVPLQRLARMTWREPARISSPHEHQQAVARVAKVRRLFGRFDDDCLQTSLVLFSELSHLGADPTLAIGFRRSDGRVAGHAWVTVNGDPVGDTRQPSAEFTLACRFGRLGSVTRADADSPAA
jgi:hypothetical protein